MRLRLRRPGEPLLAPAKRHVRSDGHCAVYRTVQVKQFALVGPIRVHLCLRPSGGGCQRSLLAQHQLDTAIRVSAVLRSTEGAE